PSIKLSTRARPMLGRARPREGFAREWVQHAFMPGIMVQLLPGAQVRLEVVLLRHTVDRGMQVRQSVPQPLDSHLAQWGEGGRKCHNRRLESRWPPAWRSYRPLPWLLNSARLPPLLVVFKR